jgi:hypothetical protein
MIAPAIPSSAKDLVPAVVQRRSTCEQLELFLPMFSISLIEAAARAIFRQPQPDSARFR